MHLFWGRERWVEVGMLDEQADERPCSFRGRRTCIELIDPALFNVGCRGRLSIAFPS